MKKLIVYVLTTLLLINCSSLKHRAYDSYVFKKHTPWGLDLHKLELEKMRNYFTYEYIDNIYGKKTGVIHGAYTKKSDSLFLKIIYPIEYKIKKSFVSYSNCQSQDSIYLRFFSLYPEIEKIHRDIYGDVSISLLENCMTDTCPSYESAESSFFPCSYSGETIVIPRSYYGAVNEDSLRLFYPNEDPIYKKIPIEISSFNCINIYLARKPEFDFIEIPIRFNINKKRLYFIDTDGKKRHFKKTRR